MKNNNLDFLSHIDFCLKRNNIRPKSDPPSAFIMNRWMSMTNKNTPTILNLTTNKWLKHLKNFNYISFYRKIIPSYVKNISYIKKKEIVSHEQENDYLNISKLMECSFREILNYEETLEYLNNTNK